MADFTTPYQAFPPSNAAFRGASQGMNALMAVDQMKFRRGEREKENAMRQQGLDMRGEQLDMQKEQFELQKPMIAFDYIKRKNSDVAAISQKISGMPRERRSAAYRNLVEKVMPMPIVEDSPIGPLGIMDSSGFVDPEDFAKMSDESQKKYLKTVYSDSQELNRFELEDLQNQNKLGELKQQHDYSLKELSAREGSEIRTIQERGKQNRMTDAASAGAGGAGGAGGGAGAEKEFKASDNAPFLKALEHLYKFEIDAGGNLRFGGSEQEGLELLAIVDKAHELYKKGGLTHGQAAKKAAEEFGKEFPSPVGSKSSAGGAMGGWKNYLNVESHRPDDRR